MSGFKFPDEKNDDTVVDDKDTKQTSNEIEIEVVDDTPEKDRGRKPLEREVADPTDDELDNYGAGVKKRLAELTHARHDERRAKEQALREKQELEAVSQRLLEENRKLRERYTEGEKQYVATYASAAEMELDQAKRNYKAAYEAGDPDAMVAAQEALVEAKGKVQAAKNFRPTALQEPEEVVQIAHTRTEAPKIDEKAVRWQAKNQWFGADGYEDMTSFSLGLHQKLVKSGVDPRSDEYFEQIDARLKSTFPDFFGAAEVKETEDKPKSGDGSKKPATVVAPGTRSTGAKKIQLTATQVALAKRLGLTPQQYALELAKLEK